MAQAGLVHGPSLNEPPSGPDTGPVCDSHSSQQLRAGFGRIHRFTRCPGRFRPVMSACSLATLAEEIAACRLCPRLVEHREAVAVKKRASFRDWTYWARGVPGFGDPDARVLVIGLAPGAHGANRTGRVFTGDASGRFLWAALSRDGVCLSADLRPRGRRAGAERPLRHRRAEVRTASRPAKRQ